MHLTPKQKKVFDFISSYIKKHDVSPSYDEIRTYFGYRSFNSVFKHVKQIESRGFIATRPNKKRAITIVPQSSPSVPLKLYGMVAAGEPIDPVEWDDTVAVPEEYLGRGENFCLQVRGDSMIGDGIFDGDTIIINKRDTANNSEMVVAMINDGVTLKRFFARRGKVELRPSNPALEPIWIDSGDIRIFGVVIGLLRKF